jgi:hypothetical protein
VKKRFTIPVAHVNYEVVLTRRPPRVGKEPVQGYCDYRARKIAVHLHSNLEVVRQTIFHEFFHALLYELGRGDLCQNEALVEGVALSVARVRLQEPWL